MSENNEQTKLSIGDSVCSKRDIGKVSSLGTTDAIIQFEECKALLSYQLISKVCEDSNCQYVSRLIEALEKARREIHQFNSITFEDYSDAGDFDSLLAEIDAVLGEEL